MNATNDPTSNRTSNETWWGSGENYTTSIIDSINFTTVISTDWSWNTTSTITSVNVSDLIETSPPLNETNASITSSGISLDSSTTTTTTTAAAVLTAASTSDGLRIFAGVSLILVTAFALCGNIGVIIAFRHKCYTDRALYTFLNNLAITMVCDCFFNAPFIAGALFSGGTMWLHATFLCPMTSFTFNLIHTQIILSLMLLVIDRVLSLKYSDSYIAKIVGVKANLISGYTWLHSMAFTLAIVVTSVKSDYFQHRYLCSITYENNLAFNVVYSLLCNIAPWITVMCGYIYIVSLASETNARDNVLTEAGYGELTLPIGTPVELSHAKPVGILIFLWCVLIGPYHILDMIYIYSGNTSIPGALWTVCTCFKFIFDLLVAIVILTAWPESWKECKHFITCRRDNAITETGVRDRLATPGVRSSWADGSDGSVTDRSTLDRSTIGRSFPVPVLFATANGLRLQVNTRGSQDGGDIEVADFAENSSQKYRTGSRPPPYLPPLFSVVQSSEEDSFNTDSSMPLKGEDNGLFDLNESADSKTAISQFQLSLGKSEDFHALKSTTPSSDISPSPRGKKSLNDSSPRHYSETNYSHETRRKSDYAGTVYPSEKQKRNASIQNNKYPVRDSYDQTNTSPRRGSVNEKPKRNSKDEINTTPTNVPSPPREENQIKNNRERSRKTSSANSNNRDNGGVSNANRFMQKSREGLREEDNRGRGNEGNVHPDERGGGGARGGRRVSSSGGGGGRGGGSSGAVGRGLKSREEVEKRQKLSSGKSNGSEKPSLRGAASATKTQTGPGRPK